MTQIMEDQSSAQREARVKAQGGLQALGKGGNVRVAGFVQNSFALGNGVGTTRDDAMVETEDGSLRLYTSAKRVITAAEIHAAIGGLSPMTDVLNWMTMTGEVVADILLACAGKDAEYLNKFFIATYADTLKTRAAKKSAKEWVSGSPKVVLASILEQITALKDREDWDADDYTSFGSVSAALEELDAVISGS